MGVNCAELELHGQRFSYRMAGEGPLVVLLHGIAGTSATWEKIIFAATGAAHGHRPDLLGHGDSAKPPGDYSLGAYAN